eukprot:scaffold5314_cov167-Amphora_coffeaeformis.AAC.5
MDAALAPIKSKYDSVDVLCINDSMWMMCLAQSAKDGTMPLLAASLGTQSIESHVRTRRSRYPGQVEGRPGHDETFMDQVRSSVSKV